MLRKLRKNYRRLVAFMLTVAMTFTNVFTNLNVAFAAGEEQEALFLVDGEDLREAIDSAVDGGETFKFSSLELKAKTKSLKASYEKLIGGKNGKVYQLDVDVDERYAPEDTSIEVFYNAGTEEVIFLFINESDMVVKFRANVDGYETARVTINPNAANVDDTEASYVEDYSNTNMIDDMPHTLGAEVLNPTTEAGADEGTDAGETSEAVEGPAGETGAADGNETEESSPAEETSEAGEDVEGETTDAAENGDSEIGETTEAAGSEAGETSEAAGSKEETTVADENNTTEEDGETTEETTVEETEAEESEAETEAETETEIEAEAADNEADAEDEAAGEAGAADEVQPEAGSATASISIRKIRQVASSVQVLDDADIVIDPENVPEDETPEISEDSDVEVETEEKTEAPEEEPEETTEAETEDTRAAETEETEAEVSGDDESEESSAAQETTEIDETTAADESSAADTETSATDESNAADTETSASDETSGSGDETDASEESSAADIIIEEESTAAGETDASGTPVEVESSAADSSAGETEAPEGSGDADIPDIKDGQELEDDINGAFETLGTLNGKAYNTVTIWDSANARAYKVAAKDLAGIEAVAGVYRVDYAVDPVGSASFKGSRSISEGENLYFAVVPQEGFQITIVTANGVELEEVDAETVASEAESLAGYAHIYAIEEAAEDLEIVASLEEVVEGSHPEFSDSVTVNGVTVTATAEEGIIPEGTVLSVEDVTGQVEAAVKEKLESEDSEKVVQAVLAYDINLMLGGKKLNNTWGEGADSYVTVRFSGSRIAELSKDADQIDVSTLETPTQTVEAALGGTEEMAVVDDITVDNITVNSEEGKSIDVSGDASVRTVEFETTHFTVETIVFSQRESISIAVVPEETTMRVGDQPFQAIAEVTPEENAAEITITWSSNNQKVATVTNEGLITPIGVGEAIITVTARDKDKQALASAALVVNVTKQLMGVSQQTAFFYISKLTNTSGKDYSLAWYFAGEGTVNAPPAAGSETKYYDMTMIGDKPVPNETHSYTCVNNEWEHSCSENKQFEAPNFPDIEKTVNGETITYRYKGNVDDSYNGLTYTVEWKYISDTSGANANVNGINHYLEHGNVYHVDGYAVLSDSVTVDFRVKNPGADGFASVYGDEKILVYDNVGEDGVDVEAPEQNGYVDENTGIRYNFDGWYTDSSCNQEYKYDGDFKGIKESIVFYGRYTAQDSLYYNANGGAGTMAPTIGLANSRVQVKANEYTREGYEFAGWNTSADGKGISYAVGNTYQLSDGDDVLYAQWEADTAKITFKTNGGSSVPEMTGKTDEGITDRTMPETTRTGYTFTGWYAEEELETEVSSLPGSYPAGTTTYYAAWTADESKIVFVTNGGSSVPEMTGKTDEEITDRTMPTTVRTGYTFSGWYDNVVLTGTEATQLPAAFPVGTKTYYAKWTKRTDLSYIKNYLEVDANGEPVLDDEQKQIKIKESVPVGNQTFEDTVYSDNIKEEIEGYVYKGVNVPSLTISATETDNVFNFYYTRRTDQSYTVNYLERGTGENGKDKVLHEPKVVENQTFGVLVTETALPIPGYDIVAPGQETIQIRVEKDNVKNVIDFYYTEQSPITITYVAAPETVEENGEQKEVRHGGVTASATSTANPEESATNSLKPASGTPAGSTAVPDTGYYFSGWKRLLDDGTESTTYVSTDTNFTPAKNAETGIYEEATYVAHFEIQGDRSYEIHYFYENADKWKGYREDEDGKVIVDHKATYGTKIPYATGRIETSFADDENIYTFERIDGPETVTENDAANIVKVYYSVDNAGTPDPGKPNPGGTDGIPDKYQITFTYQAAENAHGTVTGTTSEVKTIQEITRDPDTLVITSVGEKTQAHPTQPSKVEGDPKDGYSFEKWNDGKEEFLSDDALRAKAYDVDKTFTAYFKANAQEYTVRFLEEGTNKELAKEVAYSAVYDEEVRGASKRIEIPEYTFVKANNIKVGSDNKANIINVLYSTDSKSDLTENPDPTPENPGDGIPDKYQVTFTYQAEANAHGTVTGTTSEVKTIQEIRRDAEGTITSVGTVTPANPTQPSTIGTETGYHFDKWTDEAGNEYKDDPALTRERFAVNKTFTAHFTPDAQTYIVRHVDEDTGRIIETSEAKATIFGAVINGVNEKQKINGYAFVKADVLTIGIDNSRNTVNVYYSADTKSDPKADPNLDLDPENLGDGIPDKYQITFTYVAEENGTVTGTTTEVGTIQQIERDPETGVITLKGEESPVYPTQPSTVKANEGYYFLQWNDGSENLVNDDAVRGKSYLKDTTFQAYFEATPNNLWEASKRVTNIPSRGYYRVGEDATFEITVRMKPGANRPLKDITLREQLAGAYFVEYANCGYTVDAATPGLARIDRLEPDRSTAHSLQGNQK